MTAPRIVIVDDSRAIQAILSRSILSASLPEPKIHAFSSGTDALAHVRAQGADLVITDWHMPGMTGLDLLHAVRHLGSGDIKVGMVTTELSEDRLGEARRGGASFIVNKPFKEDELHAAVRTALAPVIDDSQHAEASASAAADAPTSEDLGGCLQALLAQHFGPIKFRLVPQREPSLAVFTPQVLLSLILRTDGRVLKLLAMDQVVTVMLMGGAQRAAPNAIKPLLASGAPVAAAVDPANRFVRACAAQMLRGVAKVQSSLIQRDLPKLRDAFAHSEGVQAYKLQVPGYGEGFFAVLRP